MNEFKYVTEKYNHLKLEWKIKPMKGKERLMIGEEYMLITNNNGSTPTRARTIRIDHKGEVYVGMVSLHTSETIGDLCSSVFALMNMLKKMYDIYHILEGNISKIEGEII